MTPTTDTAMAPISLDAIAPQVDRSFRDQQITFWRDQARRNWIDGFMDLARLCEKNASSWEWGTEGEP